MVQISVTPGEQNRLGGEASPYLKSAAHQPVHWFPWGEEAFERARRENKPILLDIGAVWCHWCHVMDSESYENEETARIINEHYIAVKVDRDERPDVDLRYQAAVSAISGQGGWPLTAFLTPHGEVFYGGTYFPPEDRFGRIGFPNLLAFLATAYRNEPDKIDENASAVHQALRNRTNPEDSPSPISDSIVQEFVESILGEFDSAHGGFGRAPKFPHCSAIELLLSRHDQTNETRMKDAIMTTLHHMAWGGIYDQLGGGFHRYSTDERWVVPHFEKMIYDNAYLLTNYVHAFQATGDDFYRKVAFDITRYIGEVLANHQLGGFYASQDADVSQNDDGSYFTWTVDQVRSILTESELQVIQPYYGIYETGEMRHDKTLNVLFVENNADEIASSLHIPVDEVLSLLKSARNKMIALRSKRKSPSVDKTIYANWNGMMISSYLEFSRVFESENISRMAIKSLDRILRERALEDGSISHRAAQEGTEGLLEDQVQIVDALLNAFEVTAKYEYFDKAASLMKLTIGEYGDGDRGGFLDTAKGSRGDGLLTISLKPVQDSPVASANAVAISILNKLYAFTGIPEYREFARRSLEALGGTARHNGIYSSHFHLALQEFLNPPPHIAIISNFGDPRGKELHHTALRAYRPGKTVAWYEPAAIQTVPEILVGTINNNSGPVAYVCSQYSCAPPVNDAEALASTIRTFGRP